MDVFLQLLLTGICIGAVYGLGALGFVLIFKASGVFNMGHGDIMMMGAFFMVALSTQLGINPYLALVATTIAAGLMGYLIQFTLIRPMTGQPAFAIVIITVALMFILRGLASLVWGPETYALPDMIPVGSVKIAGAYVAGQYIAGFILALVVLAVFTAYFRYTKTGLAMRATADDGQAAEGMGVRVRQITGISWALAGATAAIGGITLGMMTSVNTLLSEVSMKVLPVVVFGGLESIVGAILGGLLMGVVGNLAGGYLEVYWSGIKEVVPYIIMLLVLIFIPYGLFGEKRIERI